MSAAAEKAVKTTYIPHMSDHAYVLAAVMRNMGMAAEVLPMSNEESMTIGLDLCKGRECLPCFLTMGDLIQRSRQPGFDPAKSIYMMPGSTGPCRFGQYSLLQREILDRFGLGEIELSSPMITNSYDGLGPDPGTLRKRFWEGAVGVDILLKLLLAHRPYEIEKGAAEAAYRTSLDVALGAIEREGTFDALLESFGAVARSFERVAVDRSAPRPVIAVVGEVFVRLNDFSNREIIRAVEAAGGEVSLAGFAEWQYQSHWNTIESHRLHRERIGELKALLTEAWMRRRERQLRGPVAHLLKDPPEAKVDHTAKTVRRYYEPALEGEEIPTIARAIESARQGASGILNVMPFSCMPGIVVSAMSPRIRRDLDWIPWLDVSFDGQETTNISTRLEAFMHQVFQYQRTRRLRPDAGQSRVSATRDASPSGTS